MNKDIAKNLLNKAIRPLNAEAEQEFFGIIIEKELNFQSHKKSIIKTANQPLSEPHHL